MGAHASDVCLAVRQASCICVWCSRMPSSLRTDLRSSAAQAVACWACLVVGPVGVEVAEPAAACQSCLHQTGFGPSCGHLHRQQQCL